MSDPTNLWPEPEYAAAGIGPRHCEDVLAGSYDVPVEMESPVVLDIGANIGAFAKWAKGRWPGATIHCFEPEPVNFQLLKRTVRGLTPVVKCYSCGVFERDDKLQLFAGKYNRGEFSLYGTTEHDRDHPIVVDVLDAKKLPRADIIKVDTEGAEPNILLRLDEVGALKNVSAVMFEWHRQGDALMLLELLYRNGLALHRTKMHGEHRGEMRFIRE